MRVLLTRPRPDSEALAARLAAYGVDTLIEPLLTIVPAGKEEPNLAGVQALVVTSANGARALGRVRTRPDGPAFPVYAVGAASAAAARAQGFAAVYSASGDVAALAALIRARCAPHAGALLHIAGTRIAGDLGALLARDGFAVRRAVLYDAVPIPSLSDEARRAIAAGGIDAVLLYSPRTARIFVACILAAGLEAACEGMAALCLSPAVAEALGALRFAAVRVAARPDGDALLALLEQI